MENDISVRMFGNNRPKKLEAKLKPGPVLQRAALGQINNNAPLLRNEDVKKNTVLGLKKREIATSNLLQKTTFTKHEKENLPVDLPAKSKPLLAKDESMEVEEESGMQVEELSIAFSSQMLNVKDIDIEDAKNPQLVSAYVKDIYKYMWELEDKFRVQANHLEGQKINSRMRCILVDWLIQVHLRFTLLQETLYLTVAIIDRFLQADRSVTKDKLQLVGVTAMFIASKYEEMYIPEVGDFAYITDKTFSKSDIRRMEVHVLTTLNFYVSFPLPLHFLRRNSKAGQVDTIHHTLAKYLIELTLQEYSFSSYKSSLIAAGALYLALKLIDDGTKWNDVMEYYSGYSEKRLLPIVCRLSSLIIKSGTTKQQAVRNKYKSSKLMKISELPALKPTSRLLRTYAEKASIC